MQLALRSGMHIASFSRIPAPGWTLIVIAPEARIFAKTNQLRDRLQLVGISMALLLLFFYVVFFAYLHRRAVSMAHKVAEPISHLAALLRRIGDGGYRQSFTGSPIQELDELGSVLVDTGNRLGDANDLIVSQNAQVEQALAVQRRMNEEQRRLVEVVSHELRTPLAIIGSSSQILDRKADGMTPDEVRNRAGKIDSAVKRMSGILQKLTDSQSGELPLEDPANAKEQRLADFSANVARDAVPPGRLILTLSDNNPVIRDAPTITIVLRTILDNALRYSPPGSPIKISCSVAGGHAVIRVLNEGPGIPAAELKRIGERFFRGSNSTQTEGAGVGLHIAHKLMERIDGALTIESTGEGTVCTLVFGLAPLEANAPTLNDGRAQ
jgi:signal transduction histidine kinase